MTVLALGVLRLRKRFRGHQELRFPFVEGVDVTVGPLARAGQPDAAVQRTFVALEGFPLIRVVRDLAMEVKTLAILGEPLLQSGPFLDERLVGDLRRDLAKADEACVRELPKDALRSGGRIRRMARESAPEERPADACPPCRHRAP